MAIDGGHSVLGDAYKAPNPNKSEQDFHRAQTQNSEGPYSEKTYFANRHANKHERQINAGHKPLTAGAEEEKPDQSTGW